MKEGLWPLVLIFAVGAFAYLYLQYFAEFPILMQTTALQAAQTPGVAFASISAPGVAIIGEPVQVYASLGDCPTSGLGLYVDGNEIDYELDMVQKTLSTKIIAKVGGSLIELKGKASACQASYQLTPQARECIEGQDSSCVIGGCEGVRHCIGGAYSPCSSLPEICKPGKRATCAVNSCSIGYSECNSCGTAWGPCTLE